MILEKNGVGLSPVSNLITEVRWKQNKSSKAAWIAGKDQRQKRRHPNKDAFMSLIVTENMQRWGMLEPLWFTSELSVTSNPLMWRGGVEEDPAKGLASLISPFWTDCIRRGAQNGHRGLYSGFETANMPDAERNQLKLLQMSLNVPEITDASILLHLGLEFHSLGHLVRSYIYVI